MPAFRPGTSREESRGVRAHARSPGALHDFQRQLEWCHSTANEPACGEPVEGTEGGDGQEATIPQDQI